MAIDLHTHTTASDGSLSPSLLVKEAKAKGLKALGITDHDQVGGLEEGQKAGEEVGVRVVPGVELSCYWLENKRKEFHILGYFVNPDETELLARLDYFRGERIRRAQKILAKLNALGYAGDWEYVLSLAKGAIGQPHVARTILDNPKNAEKLKSEFGGRPGISDFIQRYTIQGKLAYVEKAGFSPQEAIRLIHQARGVAILAHPCYDLKEGDWATLEALRDWGIEGLEAWAPFNNKQETRKKSQYFEAVCKKYNWLVTGGSDYHGLAGIGAGLGLKNWGLTIPDQVVTNLERYWQNHG